MAMKITHCYRCTNPECGAVSEYRVTYDDRLLPQVCSVCDEVAEWTPSAPMVLKASWPDGHRSKNDPNWQKVKATSKLRLEKVGTQDQTERQRIQTEMDRVAGRETKKHVKAVDLIK